MIDRRDFLKKALFLAGSRLTPEQQKKEEKAKPLDKLSGGRFVTMTIPVRVNQIEAGRNKAIGFDEAKWHSVEAAKKLREAVQNGLPGARVTWDFSLMALQDQRSNYKAIRDYVRVCHGQYGDEMTVMLGGFFPNVYNTRPEVDAMIGEGLHLVSQEIGGSYKPKCVVAGFLSSLNQSVMAEVQGVHVAQGNIFSQHAIDNGDGDGSICYPYYPSTEHFCKPAQGKDDFVDCVNLDGWTVDFVAARRAGTGPGFNSRFGLGPIEALYQGNVPLHHGYRQMLETMATHYDAGFDLNGFAWTTFAWELSLIDEQGDRTPYLEKLMAEALRRWPNLRMPTMGEFGETFRAAHPQNPDTPFRFTQKGTGLFGSDANLEVRWSMGKRFRLGLIRDWTENEPFKVMDLTRYDLKVEEPKDMTRNWSLMNAINQKGLRPQDKPTALEELQPKDRDLVEEEFKLLTKL